MKKFEYVVLNAKQEFGRYIFDIEDFNALGKDGWEVVVQLNTSQLLFKREITNDWITNSQEAKKPDSPV